MIFLATAALEPILCELPFRVGYIDAALPELDRAVLQLALAERCDSLVLCDLAATAKLAAAYRLNLGWLLRSGLRVAALDCWGLGDPGADTGTRFDYGPSRAEQEELPAEVRYCGAAQRLFPVPFLAPSCGGGAFRSIDASAAPLSQRERAVARAELGLGESDRLIVFPQAGWQCAAAQRVPRLQAIAKGLPALLLAGLVPLGASIALAHVGPEPLSDRELGALGPRYRHLGQLAQPAFATLLGCADLLVGYNLAATSLGTAIACELPVLVTPSLARGETLCEVRASLAAKTPAPLSPLAESFVTEALPYVPLYAAPLSLDRILAPAFANNPLLGAIRTAELLDTWAITETAQSLLFAAASQQALRASQHQYLADVARLPSADEVLLRIVG